MEHDETDVAETTSNSVNGSADASIRATAGNDARLKFYESIADGLDEANKDEFDDVPTEPLRGAAEEYKEQVEEAPESKPQSYRIKVNGQEKDVSLDELIATAQKVESADQYLAQAKDAARRFESIQEPSKPDAPKQEVAIEDDLALARALQMGTEEDAARVIKQLRAQTPSVNSDEIIAKAVDSVNFQDAFSWFKKEYKDILDDQNLAQLAFAKDQMMIQGGDRRPYRERYKSIGDELRTWRGSPSNSFEEKKAQKSATVTNIRTASARAAAPVEDDSEESPSEVISRMAKSRGQI